MGRMSMGNLKHCCGAVTDDGTAMVSVSADDDREKKTIQSRSENRFKC